MSAFRFACDFRRAARTFAGFPTALLAVGISFVAHAFARINDAARAGGRATLCQSLTAGDRRGISICEIDHLWPIRY
jgi:hypothetical protein